jgi:hypothetical protein
MIHARPPSVFDHLRMEPLNLATATTIERVVIQNDPPVDHFKWDGVDPAERGSVNVLVLRVREEMQITCNHFGRRMALGSI